jgi:hypothetical protein
MKKSKTAPTLMGGAAKSLDPKKQSTIRRSSLRPY